MSLRNSVRCQVACEIAQKYQRRQRSGQKVSAFRQHSFTEHVSSYSLRCRGRALLDKTPLTSLQPSRTSVQRRSDHSTECRASGALRSEALTVHRVFITTPSLATNALRRFNTRLHLNTVARNWCVEAIQYKTRNSAVARNECVEVIKYETRTNASLHPRRHATGVFLHARLCLLALLAHRTALSRQRCRNRHRDGCESGREANNATRRHDYDDFAYDNH